MMTISFSPTLVADLQALHQPLPPVCVSDGIATYSGIALLAGTGPAVDTACLHNIQDLGAARVGAQPLIAAAAALVIATIVVNIGGWRGRRLVGDAAPLAALALVAGGALLFPGAFESRFDVSSSAVAGRPATGLWLVCALLLAVPVLDLVLAGAHWAQRSLTPLE